MTETTPPYAAKIGLLAALDAIEPMPAMTHEDLFIIPIRSGLGRQQAGYLTLADADLVKQDQAPPFEFAELDSGGSVPTVQVNRGLPATRGHHRREHRRRQAEPGHQPLDVAAGAEDDGHPRQLPRARALEQRPLLLAGRTGRLRAAREAVAQRRRARGGQSLPQRPGRSLGSHRGARACCQTAILDRCAA